MFSFRLPRKRKQSTCRLSDKYCCVVVIGNRVIERDIQQVYSRDNGIMTGKCWDVEYQRLVAVVSSNGQLWAEAMRR